MSISNQFKIFYKLPFQSKLIIYVTAFVFLVLIALFVGSMYHERIVLLWMGIIIFTLSIFLSVLISKTISNHIESISRIIEAYERGGSTLIKNQLQDDQFKPLFQSLDKLFESYQSNFEEKISDENISMMGEFATFIIHDLKNPISGIHLLAEGLNKKVKDNDELKKYANEILFASQKLDDFIKRTLDITKSMVIHRQQVNINQLIKDVINEIKMDGIQLHEKLDKNIPLLFADYQLLSRAITNIIVNAVEAIESDGKIIIETKLENKVQIRISDNGKGINEEKILTIFRPFYSSKGQGHGLGLAMAKKVVLMHRGTIEVNSVVGKGSVFIITLPLLTKDINTNIIEPRKE